MRDSEGFFDIDDRLKRLSDLGDQLEAFRSAGHFGKCKRHLFGSKPKRSNRVIHRLFAARGARLPF